MIPPLGATIDGTKRYFRRVQKKWMHEDKVRSCLEHTVSSLAIGTYMGHYDDETDALLAQTLETGLDLGVNFIDTAINYRCQRSEKVIGRVLNKLIHSKKIARDEVVISTKGGFIPFEGQPAPSLKNYIQQTFIDTGILESSDIVANCHSLSPRYLSHQIQTSLLNLGLDTIDIYYLHNPETQLPHVGADVFYGRMKEAFAVLEEHVEKGKIQYYGIATWNGLRSPSHASDALDLVRLNALAKEAGGVGHHFRALQMPFNLNMREGIQTIGLAQDLGMEVMTSSPLLQTQVLQKGDAFYKKIPGSFTPAQKALQFVLSQPGITSVMSGIKTLTHLKENMGVLEKAAWNTGQMKEIFSLL